jgi:glutathione S-transferase
VKSYGIGILPKAFNMTKGRQEVERLTGNRMVPTLLLDDGAVIDGSHEIAAWAQAHPATAA